ncbi:ESX secretion-associated protein EspG [Mycobacterium sp.]|uniref:ESX secretion-associated protein EspG n=1 Tax=Mycobacterium sp. TaxID=1785 RepID=UPI003BA97B01
MRTSLIKVRLNGHLNYYPPVLEVFPPAYCSDDRLRRNEEAKAWEELEEQGAVSGVFGNAQSVDAVIRQWMQVLARPDIELNTYIWRGESKLQICVARRGPLHSVAMRYGELILFQHLTDTNVVTGVPQVVAPILSALGMAAAAEFDAFSLSADEAAAIDSRVGEASGDSRRSGLREALVNGGVGGSAADFFAEAFADIDKVWRSEITAAEHSASLRNTGKGSVGILDTPSGRILAVPNEAVDGNLWSTFAPGTDTRIIRSIEEMIETLPCGSWFAAERF